MLIFSPLSLSGATKRAYEYLFEEIANNHLPAGAPIPESEIAQTLNSSRSPVREATLLLEGEGIVHRVPGQGCFVKEISAQDINEIFDLRITLELDALRLSYSLFDDDTLDRLESLVRSARATEPSSSQKSADSQFHDFFISSCGNNRLIWVLKTLTNQIEPYRRIAAQQPNRVATTQPEHLLIIKALRAKDLEKACILLKDHLNHARNRIMNAYMRVN